MLLGSGSCLGKTATHSLCCKETTPTRFISSMQPLVCVTVRPCCDSTRLTMLWHDVISAPGSADMCSQSFSARSSLVHTQPASRRACAVVPGTLMGTVRRHVGIRIFFFFSSFSFSLTFATSWPVLVDVNCQATR